MTHQDLSDRPLPFEVGDGTVDTRSKWLWPMGGELVGDREQLMYTISFNSPEVVKGEIDYIRDLRHVHLGKLIRSTAFLIQ